MSLAEIDNQFRRIRELIESGTKSLESRAYAEAQNTLFQALKEIEAMKLPPSEQQVECLEKLADAYYQEKKYIEARPVYMQLRATVDQYQSIEAENRVRMLFKLARCTDQVQDYEGAAKIFDEAVELAESCMQQGNSFLTELYEANANLLRRARLEPDKLILLERKVRLCRQKQSGITESLFDPIDEEKKRKRREEAEAYFRRLSRAQKLIHLARNHPWKALAVMFSPLLMASIVLVAVAALAFAGVDLFSSQLLAAGDVFTTPDRAVEISVNSATRARIKSSHATEARIRSLNRWSELINTLRPTPGTYWLKRSGEKLTGEDGIIYYSTKSQTIRIEDAMRKFGDAIHKHAAAGKAVVYDTRYYVSDQFAPVKFAPDITFHIDEYAFETAHSQADAKAVSVLDFAQEVEKPLPEDARDSEARLHTFAGTLPIQIRAYHYKDALAIVACDADKNTMRTTDGTKYIVFGTSNINRYAPQMNSSSSRYVPEVLGKKVLLVSDRDKEQVQKKYFHLLLSGTLLVFLFLTGFILVQQAKRQTAQIQSHYAGTQRVGEAICWLSYATMCMFYVTYIAWVIFS